MARLPAWICPQCDRRDDPRFHECADRVVDIEPPAHDSEGDRVTRPAGAKRRRRR